jgi:hypothetical protein
VISNILLPVDIRPADFHLEDYAKLFSHLEGKRFSTFFLTDLTHPKGSKTPLQPDLNKHDLQEEISQDAEKLKLDVSFLTGPSNLQLLTYQSRFADLILVSPVNRDSLEFLTQSLSLDFLNSMGCPLFLTTNTVSAFEEIIFLFDYDLSGLEALKSFIALFGNIAADRKVTVITVNPDDENGIFFEKCLISHLQKTFKDVGILPMSKSQLSRNLIDFASKETRPVLIMGQSAINLLKDKELSGEISSHQISLFYCNQ